MGLPSKKKFSTFKRNKWRLLGLGSRKVVFLTTGKSLKRGSGVVMMNRFAVAAAAGLLVASTGFLTLRAQDDASSAELTVADPICTFFGPEHDSFVASLRDGAASHETRVCGLKARRESEGDGRVHPAR